MSDPHDRFSAWLSDGAVGEPPRDLALHASSCTECLAMAGALDDLATVHLDGAELPPILATTGPRRPSLATGARWRVGAAVVATAALVVVVVGSGSLLDRDPGPGTPVAVEGATGNEGVLGGVGGEPSSSDDIATADEIPTPAATASPSDDPEPTSSVEPGLAAPMPDPPAGTAAPMPPAPGIPVGTPRASAAPTPEPSITTPAPTAAPTPPPPPTSAPTPPATPTPPPTPPPTPTPTPSPAATPGGESAGLEQSCTNGIDDDGDLLVDLVDPGCLLGDAESDL